MIGDDEEGPKDWEIRDEEPPAALRRKWDREEAEGPGLVVCPACDKETPVENLTCIFCSHEIVSSARSRAMSSPGRKTPWYGRTATLVIGFLTIGPFMLPLVWFNPVFSRRKKVVLTAVVLVLTWALVAAFVHSVKTMIAFYKQSGIF